MSDELKVRVSAVEARLSAIEARQERVEKLFLDHEQTFQQQAKALFELNSKFDLVLAALKVGARDTDKPKE